MAHHIAAIIQKHDIILFDAICVICNGCAKFLIKNDQHSKFKLASAQSALGEQILQYYGMSTTDYTTMVVILNGQLYTESTALLKVMQHLGLPFSLMNAGYIIPRPIRDFLYRCVALNRYQLFGQTNDCLLPSADNKQHFLEHALRNV
ncbi:thiol-disulfide oxidoreductase [Acinetobacter sp. ANC 4654]|uniref:thiol-disulfide oxidoreductase DCC family protein n=1 Tax=Acinetobacter sp. ANC 4654 TaxID=1977872 RepID=UPI000A350A54|nr:DCC1-like thiol-disulfide oxidoreductase family protein [Acinetobacter sp. ANC 4654]OTG97018.1 thiol-disulfide oxidoreductase [Acinetobacter sp. ANC 4654]